MRERGREGGMGKNRGWRREERGMKAGKEGEKREREKLREGLLRWCVRTRVRRQREGEGVVVVQ